ncbi:hypothetical protein [Pukyongiella litopenaei]|uniref:HTH cro/C1-type domain-containing protein n=1 Tax=Pukyongiella litopenaei TaxID=2605946 RepID=A0A2S0ML49_9RHOB|nr:hypothetical protein [Pukyongiella litopenaei]AVO36615.1 hypothetical protein C6Y53_02145 [Pukyongiella litopenaei]
MTDNEKHWTVAYLSHVLEAMDWSMNRLATETGLAASTINRPMREDDWKFGLSSKTVQKIHAATGIDPADFMPTGFDEPTAMWRAADTYSGRTLRRLLDDKESTPDRDRGNEIKIAIVGSRAQIVATVDKAGLAKLRAKLELLADLLED